MFSNFKNFLFNQIFKIKCKSLNGVSNELNNMSYKDKFNVNKRYKLNGNIITSKRCPICNHIVFKKGWKKNNIKIEDKLIFVCPICKNEIEIE